MRSGVEIDEGRNRPLKLLQQVMRVLQQLVPHKKQVDNESGRSSSET